MITLSIDHGTTSGYAIFEHTETEVTLKDSGFIYFTSSSKYDYIYNTYLEKISHVNPEIIVLEKINLSGVKFNANAILRLCEIRAMIKLIADELDIIVVEVNPMSMKKFITGSGRGTKYDVAKSVCMLFDKNYDDIPKIRTKNPLYDECDAIALGYYGISHYYAYGDSVFEQKPMNRIWINKGEDNNE